MGIRFVLIMMMLAVSVYGQTGSEQVILPGREYMAGTRVQNAYRGVSFIVPRGWKGAMPPDQRVFLMSSDSQAGIGIAIFRSEVSEENILQYLRQPQNLGDNIILKPVGDPRIAGAKITMNYTSMSSEGKALAISGPYQNTVLFLFAGPSSDKIYFEKLLEKLGSSVIFSRPDPGKLRKAWEKVLTGMALKKVSVDDSEGVFPSLVHLCPNGKLHYSLPADPTQIGSSQSLMDGTWSLEISEAQAFLVVHPSGRQPVRASLDMAGSYVMLQGGKYFLTDSDVCR